MSWTKDILPRHALIINDINESNWFTIYNPQLVVLGDNLEFLQALMLSDNQKILAATQSAQTMD